MSIPISNVKKFTTVDHLSGIREKSYQYFFSYLHQNKSQIKYLTHFEKK